ncbi:hypothetical protein [Acidocella sp.]|uniref:hypothetical protein n=1 Tax=Acidocella sp. TaxID=50710 RepID=UPI00260638E4|nr:hypothetical protein [Acidocella sp.]
MPIVHIIMAMASLMGCLSMTVVCALQMRAMVLLAQRLGALPAANCHGYHYAPTADFSYQARFSG